MITLKRIRCLIGLKEALLLFKANILPYYDFGDLFYDVGDVDQVRRLPKIQN